MPEPQVWSVEPNGDETYREEYGYDTDIMRAKSGMEQRVQLRAHPIMRIEASFLCDRRYDAGLVHSLLYGHLAGAWLLPLWHHGRRLLTPLAPGATNVEVDTADAPWTDPLGLGDSILIWRDSQTWEVVALTSVGSSLTVAPVVGTWATTGTYVTPLRTARLEGDVTTRWLTNQILEARLRWRCDDHEKNPPSSGGGSDFVIIDEIIQPAS